MLATPHCFDKIGIISGKASEDEEPCLPQGSKL